MGQWMTSQFATAVRTVALVLLLTSGVATAQVLNPWRSAGYAPTVTGENPMAVWGYEFTPLVSGTVTQLCGYFNGFTAVNLYDRAVPSTPIASVPSIASGNSWVCTNLGTPVALTAGKAYSVGASFWVIFGGAYGVRRPMGAGFFPKTYGKVRIEASCVASVFGGTDPCATTRDTGEMFGWVDIGIKYSELSFTVGPTDAARGVSLAPSVKVSVLNADGSVDTTSTASVTVALGNNPSGATLGGVVVVPAVAGVATFANVSVDKVGDGFTLVATAAGMASGTSSAFNVRERPWVVNEFGTLSTNEAGAYNSGFQFTPLVGGAVYELCGYFGGGTRTVRLFALPAGTEVRSASVTSANAWSCTPVSPYVVTAGAHYSVAVELLGGEGSSRNLGAGGLPKTYGSLTIEGSCRRASSAAEPCSVSGLITDRMYGQADVGFMPHRLVFATQPSTQLSGTAISPAPVVTLRDAAGAAVSSFTGPVAVSLLFNPAGATLSGTSPVSAAGGSASFADLSVDRVVQSLQLLASSPGYVDAASATFGAYPVASDAWRSLAVSPPSVDQAQSYNAGFGFTPQVSGKVTQVCGYFNGTKTVRLYQQTPVSVLGAYSVTSSNSWSCVYISPVALVAGAKYTIAMESQGTGLASQSTMQALPQTAGYVTIDKSCYTSSLNEPCTQGASFTAWQMGLVDIGFAPDRLTFTSQPVATMTNTPISPPVVVTARDPFGSTVSGFSSSVTVALGANPGGSVLGGTQTQVPVAGVATFGDLTLDKQASGYTLVASASGMAPGTSNAFAVAQSPWRSNAFGSLATNQPGAKNAGYQFTPLYHGEISNLCGYFTGTRTIRLFSGLGGSSVGSATVTSANSWACAPISPGPVVVSAGGVYSVAADLQNGESSTRSLGAGGLPKTYDGITINGSCFVSGASTEPCASSGLVTDTMYGQVDVVFAPYRLAYTQQPASVVAGTAFAPAVAVALYDASGNVLSSSSAQVTLAIGNNPGGGALAGTTSKSATSGQASFPGVSINRNGNGYTLVASSAGFPAATSPAFNISVGPAVALAFKVPPSDVVVNLAMAPPVVVAVQDAAGNSVPTATGTISLALFDNPGASALSGGAATLVGGEAVFPWLSLNKVAAGYTLRATGGGVPAVTSVPFNVTVGTPSKLLVVVQPTTVVAGATLVPDVAVSVCDAQGNVIPNSTAAVTLTLSQNPGADLWPGTVVNAVNGVATLAAFSLQKAGVGYRLWARSNGLTAAFSQLFDVLPGPVAGLAFFTPPSNSEVGVFFFPPVRVALVDGLQNPVADSTSSVSLTLGNANGATLVGDHAKVFSGGVATFASTSVNKAGTGYTLSAAVQGYGPVVSAPFNVVQGASTRLAFRTQPTDVDAAASMTPPTEVVVQDLAGNVVAGFFGSIQLALGTNPGGATLAGTVSAAAVAGVAQFPGLSLNRPGSGYTFIATAAGMTPVSSEPFSVRVGAPARLWFSGQPTNVVAGATVKPAVKVVVQDAAGNLTSQASLSVTVAIAANPGGGALLGERSRPVGAGEAVFSDLSVDRTGVGYTLVATAPGVTQAVSATFDVRFAPGRRLAFVTQPAGGVAGEPFGVPPTVAVQDSYGNLVADSTARVALALGKNPAGAILSGSTWGDASGGMATFADVFLNRAGDGFSLVASAQGLEPATSADFAVALEPAGGIAPFFVSRPRTEAVAGEEYLYDEDGVPAVQGTGPFSFALVSGPEGVELDPATGALRWVPGDTGAFEFVLEVAGKAGSDRQTWSVGVSPSTKVSAPPRGCGCGTLPAETGSFGWLAIGLVAWVRSRRKGRQ